jgi:hypothetical protein
MYVYFGMWRKNLCDIELKLEFLVDKIYLIIFIHYRINKITVLYKCKYERNSLNGSIPTILPNATVVTEAIVPLSQRERLLDYQKRHRSETSVRQNHHSRPAVHDPDTYENASGSGALGFLCVQPPSLPRLQAVFLNFSKPLRQTQWRHQNRSTPSECEGE